VLAQLVEIRKFTGREIGVDHRGELCLACAIMGEREQSHQQ
jgi:hypothetical protein